MNLSHALKPTRTSTPNKSRKILVAKVDSTPETAIEVSTGKNMDALLKNLTSIFDLNRPATQILDENFHRIASVKDIPDDKVVYVSCAKIQTEETAETLYKKRTVGPTELKIKLPPVEPVEQEPRPPAEIIAQHQAIAASPNTVRENMRDALVSLYASLPPETAAELPENEELKKLLQDTQTYLFQDSLVSELICPTSAIYDSPYYKQTYMYMLEKMKGYSPDDCKFVITGPIQSGKSTLLNIAASIFFLKCQFSNELSNYLIVPINFLIHSTDFTDFAAIFETMVRPTLKSLKIARPEFTPYIKPLLQWFLGLTESALPGFPPNIVFPANVSKQAIQMLGTKIHRLWSNNLMKDFVAAAASFPRDFAAAFGFKNCVLILDHFEMCRIDLPDSPVVSDVREKPNIDFASLLSHAVGDGPFIVAPQYEGSFFACFDVNGFNEVGTQRIVSNPSGTITLSEPRFEISGDICAGCPAYCVAFERLYNTVKEMNERAPPKSLAKFTSVVDQFRRTSARQEVARFVSLFEDDFSDDILETVQVEKPLYAQVSE